jgi:hypothetical protein
MKVKYFSKTLGEFQLTTRRYIPQDTTLVVTLLAGWFGLAWFGWLSRWFVCLVGWFVGLVWFSLVGLLVSFVRWVYWFGGFVG